ncbi:MAG: hypothetical protein HKM02_07755 [Pseudomonadales bacterium]|nr:hypothetical protein [Pseudomonadales bacterium]
MKYNVTLATNTAAYADLEIDASDLTELYKEVRNMVIGKSRRGEEING